MSKNKKVADVTELPVQHLGEDAPSSKDVRVVVDESGPVNKRGRVILSVLIIILIILLLLACAFLANMLGLGDKGSADTGGLQWIRSIYSFGPAVDQNIAPTSVAADPGGKYFWICDNNQFRLVRFDWNGKFEEVWTQDADGNPFQSPSDIAFSRDGWMYVCQSTYDNVKVYDQNKKLQQTLDVPKPMSVDVNDDMVVVGSMGGYIAYSRSGSVIGYIGEGRGTGDNSFDTVNGITIDDENNVYVVDSFNNRLSKYNAEGDRVWMIGLGRPGNAGADVRNEDMEGLEKKYPAMLQLPMGCTIDAAGRIVIIDCLDFSISAFSPKDGEFLGKWGQYGTEDGQLAYSSDIDYDTARDWFVVTDSGNHRAEIFKVPGSGGGLGSTIRAALTGPLGACCIPLLLIILFVILYTVWRWLQRRREKNELERDRDQAIQKGEDVKEAMKAGLSPGEGPKVSAIKEPPGKPRSE